MHRITPTIFNGSNQVILSETICCNPKLGVQVRLPITNENWVEFRFVFQSDSDLKKGATIFQEGNILTFTLINFLGAFGSSLLQPYEFRIGEDKFFLQIYGASPGQNSLCMTISILKEIKNG